MRPSSLAALLCGALLLAPATPPRHPARTTVMLPHPVQYQQSYISSCEAAATHIALQMSGVDVPEQRLIDELPMDRRSAVYDSRGSVIRWGDPYQSFVGDISRGDSWPVVGYGVYAPPILRLVQRHGMRGSFGGSGMSLDTLRQAIDAGHPVIVWVPKLSLYSFAPTLKRRYWTTWQGQRVPWEVNEHAQVLVGYDATGFYLDNPDYKYWSNHVWLWHYTLAEFRRGWDILGDQAIVVQAGVERHAPTPAPSATAHATATPTATLAPRPSATPTRTPRPTATATTRPTATPTHAPTTTATRSPSATPTSGIVLRLPTFPPWPTAVPTTSP